MKVTVGGTPETVRLAVPLLLPELAVMVTVPPLAPEASPVELTVAIAGLDDTQVTELVMFALVPSV